MSNVQNVAELKKAIYLVNTGGELRGHRIDLDEHEIGKIQDSLRLMFTELSKIGNSSEMLAEGLRSRLKFWMLENYIIKTMDAMAHMLDGIDRVIIEGRNHKAAPEGLGSVFLIEQLQKIESECKHLSPIFGSNEYERYYETSLALVARHKGNIWISLRIPLVNFNQGLREIHLTDQISKELNTLEKMGVSDPKWFRGNDGSHSFISGKRIMNCLKMNEWSLCEGRLVLVNSAPTSTKLELDEIWAETDKRDYFVHLGRHNISGMTICGKEQRDFLLNYVGVIYLDRSCELKTARTRIGITKTREGSSKLERETFRIQDGELIGHMGSIHLGKTMLKLERKIESFANVTELGAGLREKTLLLSKQINETLSNVNSTSLSNVWLFSQFGLLGLFVCLLLYVIWDIKMKCMNKRRGRCNIKPNEAESTNSTNDKLKFGNRKQTHHPIENEGGSQLLENDLVENMGDNERPLF